MKLHGIKLRENVQIAGITIVWVTNLSDEDIYDFYQQLITDPDYISFTGRKDGVDGTKGISISFHIFGKTINFKDGCCQCFGVFDTLCLIYRTTEEWDLLENHYNLENQEYHRVTLYNPRQYGRAFLLLHRVGLIWQFLPGDQ